MQSIRCRPKSPECLRGSWSVTCWPELQRGNPKPTVQYSIEVFWAVWYALWVKVLILKPVSKKHPKVTTWLRYIVFQVLKTRPYITASIHGQFLHRASTYTPTSLSPPVSILVIPRISALFMLPWNGRRKHQLQGHEGLGTITGSTQGLWQRRFRWI